MAILRSKIHFPAGSPTGYKARAITCMVLVCLCLAISAVASPVPQSPLFAELLEARRTFDLNKYKAAQQRIVREANFKPGSFEAQFEAAESHRIRASWEHTAADVGLVQGAAKEASKKAEVAAATEGMQYGRSALKLSRTKAEKAQANRVMGELYTLMISDNDTKLRYGPKGMRHIKKGGKMAPDDPECTRVYGLFFLAAPSIVGGDKPRGMKMLQSIVEKVPESDAYRVLLSIAYRDAENPNITAALAQARKAVELNPVNRHAQFLVEQLDDER